MMWAGLPVVYSSPLTEGADVEIQAVFGLEELVFVHGEELGALVELAEGAVHEGVAPSGTDIAHDDEVGFRVVDWKPGELGFDGVADDERDFWQ